MQDRVCTKISRETQGFKSDFETTLALLWSLFTIRATFYENIRIKAARKWRRTTTSMKVDNGKKTLPKQLSYLRYATSRCVDLGDARFWIGSKNTWDTRILHGSLQKLAKIRVSWVFRGFCKDFARIFWVFNNLMMHGFWDTCFLQEPKTA